LYKDALKEVIQVYNKTGFKIIKIRADNKFRPLKETMLKHFGIKMNFTNPQEHVPEAERNHQVIKEGIKGNIPLITFQAAHKSYD
jgi:hypothetical protein